MVAFAVSSKVEWVVGSPLHLQIRREKDARAKLPSSTKLDSIYVGSDCF